MSELRDFVIAAHGGIERWINVKTIDGDMSITGLTWARKGWPDVLKVAHVAARTQSQWINRPFISKNMRSVCTPDHTIIEAMDGKPLKDRRNPREAFQDHTLETKWDDLNLAYFSGYARWSYLSTPFIFLLPGVKNEEIEPWDEYGEQRHRLKVTFPDSVATHCAEQIFHVSGEGLISRLDYSARVAGGVPTAHYLAEDFDGIRIATKRRAYRRNPDGTAYRSRSWSQSTSPISASRETVSPADCPTTHQRRNQWATRTDIIW